MATAAAPMPNAQVRKAQRNLAAFRIHCGGLIHCGKEYSRRSQDEMFMMPNVKLRGCRAFAAVPLECRVRRFLKLIERNTPDTDVLHVTDIGFSHG